MVRFARSRLLTLAVAGAVVGLALDSGGYALTTRNAVAILVWWAVVLAVAVSAWPIARLPRAALVTGGLLGAFALFTGLSIAWADSAEKAFAELDRILLYLGIFTLAVAAGSRENVRRWSDGIAIGIVVVGLLALSSRLFGDLVGHQDLSRFLPGVVVRLSYPVDYWNGLAMLVALAFPFLLEAATIRRAIALRAIAVAPVPALVAVIYLTSSRGGAATALVGTAVLMAITGRRLEIFGAFACAAAGSAAVIAILHARPELVDGPLQSAAASSQGKSAALLIGLVCLGVGLAYGLGARLLPRPSLSWGRGLKRALALAGALVFIGAVAAAGPRERFERFKQPPSNKGLSTGGYTQAHLLSGGGSGRWQFWSAATDEFETRPALGRGAGSYEAWWAEHGSLSYFVRDAHSLYVETLAELGLVGLFLLLAAFGSGLAACLTRLRASPPEDRGIVAVLVAAFAAYALAAGIDWMWELPVVSVIAVACLGLLVGPATAARAGTGEARSERRRFSRSVLAARAAVVAVGLSILVAQAIPLLAQDKIRDSQEAIARADGTAALEDALSASRLQPWASSPYLQLALVQEQTGDLGAARRSIAKAIDRDHLDWRLWLVSARLDTRAGRTREAKASLREARRLNPRSPLFAS